MINKTAYNKFARHALREWPKEACGLVVDNKYIPCVNHAAIPAHDFTIRSEDYLRETKGKTLNAILHTHAIPLYIPAELRHLDPRTPSLKDMQGQHDTAVPWGIAATEGENVTPLVWLGVDNNEPLIGRKFIHGINDCYSLVRDYYKIELNTTLPECPREYDWWSGTGNLYVDNYARAGFVVVPFEEREPGDVLLISIMSPVPNHAGVFLGEDKMMHHYQTRLSGEDSVSKWKRRITHTLRYKGDKNAT
tara:strand:- start:2710 stop:3456 length:747 start_codon:yes stop_codon:yes gene_type:complete